MRISPLRHPLAVLRSFLELGQKEMAALIGCSGSAVQSIELNKLKLTEQLAQRIVRATNINFDWLLGANSKARMLNAEGLPYSQQDFENSQGRLNREMDPEWAKESEMYADIFADHYRDRLYNILVASLKKGRYQWVWWKVEAALKELEKEFEVPFVPIPFSLPPETKEEIERALPSKPVPKKAAKKSGKSTRKK